MNKRVLLALVALPLAWGQSDVSFRGRRGWTLANDRLRVTVLEGGGHIAELTLKNPPGGREVNPLWIPTWPSIEPPTYKKDTHGAIYGTDSEAATLSGIMGHNVCFDYWGAPSPSEFRAGLSFHGEASTIAWRRISSAGELQLAYRAELPQSRASLTRTLRLRAGQPVLYFEETAENPTAFDRPFGWVQHVTFGPPFLDANHSAFDASATRGERRVGGQTREFQWPQAEEKDFRRFSSAAQSADMAFLLLDPGREVEFVSALNTEFRQLVAYLFKRQDFPWLNVWEQNRSRQEPPWKGDTRTRGMEFGNTRVSGTHRAYFRLPLLWNTSTFGWLEAKGKLTARYLAVVIPIPAGFEGVRDIRVEGGEIVIQGSRGEPAIRVPLDRTLF